MEPICKTFSLQPCHSWVNPLTWSEDKNVSGVVNVSGLAHGLGWHLLPRHRYPPLSLIISSPVGSKPIPCTCVIPKMSLKSRMPPNFDAYARSCRRHRPGVPCGRQVVPAIAVAVQGSTEEGRQDAIRLGDSFPQAVVAPLAAGACETKPHHAAPHSLLDLSIRRLKVEEEGLTLHLHQECGGVARWCRTLGDSSATSAVTVSSTSPTATTRPRTQSAPPTRMTSPPPQQLPPSRPRALQALPPLPSKPFALYIADYSMKMD